jgi:hypothetical protein
MSARTKSAELVIRVLKKIFTRDIIPLNIKMQLKCEIFVSCESIWRLTSDEQRDDWLLLLPTAGSPCCRPSPPRYTVHPLSIVKGRAVLYRDFVS